MPSPARKQSHATPTPAPLPRRQWRDYRTPAGGRPIKDFIDTLTDDEAAEVVVAMREVAEVGLAAAKHLRTQKTPWAELELATQRLRDWRARGEERRRTENSPSGVRS